MPCLSPHSDTFLDNHALRCCCCFRVLSAAVFLLPCLPVSALLRAWDRRAAQLDPNRGPTSDRDYLDRNPG
jgi:hypothetical protein